MRVSEEQQGYVSLSFGVKVEAAAGGIGERELWFGEGRRNQSSLVVGFPKRGPPRPGRVRWRLGRGPDDGRCPQQEPAQAAACELDSPGVPMELANQGHAT